MGLAEMAAKTPTSRDRAVDLLRAFSIITVVLGHWFIAIILVREGRIGVISAIGATSGLWLGTWIFQVMPIFFFVGGFSNYVTFEAMRRRGEGYREFVRARAARLLSPTLIFLGLWLVGQVVLHVIDEGGDKLIRGSFLPFAPLWFLFVYIAIIAATPVMLRLHHRFGVGVPVALILAVAVVDTLRFAADVPGIGWVNLASVWLFAHQLGFFYADGSLVGLGKAKQLALAGVGLAGLIVLTNIGVYPRSMLGTDVERVSNMNPPTACIMALTLWQVGLAMLLRERLQRWLAKPRAWTAVIAANAVIMTIFLWHMTAYVLAVLLLRPLGLADQTDTTTAWWLERPVWWIVPAAILAVLVVIFGRFERPRAARRSGA
ncbi:MAG: acyltransferase family protein [Actinomycetota bacterium]